MYISNMAHFLDENGNIAGVMPREGRVMASFLAMVIDASTTMMEEGVVDVEIRCNRQGCQGAILAEICPCMKEIHWGCTECDNDGIISGWRGTKWDNSGGRTLSDEAVNI